MKNNKMTREEKRRLLFNKKYEISQKRIQKYGTDSVGAIAVDFNKRFVAAFLALVFALSCLVVGVNFASRAEENVDRTYLISNGASLEDGFAMLDDVDSTDGMVLRKGLKKNNDGTYDLRMEAYATGASKEVTEQIPTDFVLVIDQSGSMAYTDMPVGDTDEYYTAAGSSWSFSTIGNEQEKGASGTAYYYRDSNGNYYRVYAKRGYMYEYIDATSWYMDSLFNKYKYFHYFADGTMQDVSGGSNGYYYKVDDNYYLIYGSVKGTAASTDLSNRWFAYNVWVYYDDEDGVQHTIENSCTGTGLYSPGVIYDFHGSIDHFVYRQLFYQRASLMHSCKFGHPLYKRYIGYNELCYKDADGNEISLASTDYCSSGTPTTTETGTTEMKYSGTLYTATSTESRLQALNTSAKAFIDLVASQTNTKANGTTERVDHRIAVVGFASDNTSSYTYNNNELLSPDTSVEDNTSFVGTSLDGIGHDGPQYGSSDIENAYANALVSTKTDAGKESLKTSIDYVTAYGGTEPETGFKMAYNVLNSRSATDKQYTKMDGTIADRNTVVIFFTDGRPGNYSYSNQYEAANKVVAEANNIKQNLNTPIYSIGVFGESDGSPLTYSKYQVANSSSSVTLYGTTYYSYTDYQYETYESYTDVLTNFSYDTDYDGVAYPFTSTTDYAHVLYRIWQSHSSGYSSPASDTIADYMRTVSSEYPNATDFVAADWYDADTSKRSGTYDDMVTSVRRTKGSGKYYYIATSASALTTAFSDIFESTIGEGTTSSVTYNDTNSYLKDIITDQFDTSNATGTVSVYSANNITDVTDGNPTVNSWTLVDPTPSGIDVSYSSNTVTDSDFKKAWEVTGFDYSDHYVAAANTAKAQKVVLTISGLTTTNTGSLTTNSSDSGIYTYATTSGESDSKESSFPVPTTSRKKYDLQYTGDNASGTDVMVMLKLSNNGAPVSGTFSGLIFDENGLAEWMHAADDSELIVEDLPSDYKLEAYVINNDSSGSYDYTLKLDDTNEAFWQSASTTNAFELTETEQTITIDSTANSKDVTIIETTTGTYADTSRAFPITLTLRDKDNYNVSGTYNYELGDGTTSSVTFTDGTGTISLSNGQTATLKALPYNAALTVEPTVATYYTQSVELYSSSDTSKTATINTDGITFNVNYVRQDVTDSGILDNTNPISKWMFVIAGALAVLAIVFAVWQKRKNNLTE